MILFAATVIMILLVVLVGLYLVYVMSEDGLTFNELDHGQFIDRAHIALASQAAWNDPD